MWRRHDDGRAVYRVLHFAGGDQPAEYLADVCGCVGFVEVRNAGAAMSEDEIKQRLFGVWVVIAILIFAVNMLSLSVSGLAGRVNALEQSETSETQQ